MGDVVVTLSKGSIVVEASVMLPAEVSDSLEESNKERAITLLEDFMAIPQEELATELKKEVPVLKDTTLSQPEVVIESKDGEMPAQVIRAAIEEEKAAKNTDGATSRTGSRKVLQNFGLFLFGACLSLARPVTEFDSLA